MSRLTGLSAGLFFLAVFIAVFFSGVLAEIELNIVDGTQKIARSRIPDDDIIMVGITDDCLGELNGWPFSRELFAGAIQNLSKDGAKVIGLDILFEEPGQNEHADALLISAVKDAKNVVLTNVFKEIKIVSQESSQFFFSQHSIKPFSGIAEHMAGIGFSNGEFRDLNAKGVVRYMVSSHFDGEARKPSFALAIARLAQDEDTIGMQQLSDVSLCGLAPISSLKSFSGIWSSDNRHIFPLNYKRSFKTVHFSDVVNNSFNPGKFKDKIVIVGPMATGLGDYWVTPVGLVAGMEIHATFLSNLLKKEMLRELPISATILLIAIFCLSGSLNAISSCKLSSQIFFLGLFMVFYAVAFSYSLSHVLYMIPIVLPVLAILTSFTATRFLIFNRALIQANQNLEKSNKELVSTNHDLDRKNHELFVLNEAGAKFQESVYLDEMAQEVLHRICDLKNISHACLLSLVDEIQIISKIGNPVFRAEMLNDEKINEYLNHFAKDSYQTILPDSQTILLKLANAEMNWGLLWLQADSGQVNNSFSDDFWRTLLGLAATSLANARLFSIANEVTAARNIQQRLLPNYALVVEELRVHGVSKAATQMGGDYFDYAEIDKHGIVVFIADVVGHGVPAAIGTTIAKSVFLQFVLNGLKPLEFLSNLNSIIKSLKSTNCLMTGEMVYFDRNTGETTFFHNGGIFPIYLPKGGQACYLELGGGTMLGVPRKLAVKEHRLELNSGDRLILLTDGMIEAFGSSENDEYTAFLGWLQNFSEVPFENYAQTILDKHPANLSNKSQPDDFTIVVIERC